MVDAVSYIISIVLREANIFAAPIHDLDMLWILIPVYLSGIFADYFQEKKSTSLGNAISNGFVALWVGIDWCRQLTKTIDLKSITSLNVIQAIVAISLITYGIFIMFEGIKGKKFTHYIGRIREVTYIIICVTPVFYGIVPADLTTVIAILLFLPLWYGIWELIMHFAPETEASLEGTGGEGGEFGKDLGGEIPEMPDLGGGMPLSRGPQQPGGGYPQQPGGGYPQQPGGRYPPGRGY